MIRIHHTTPRSDGQEGVTLACDCKPEHRIDFTVENYRMHADPKAERARLVAARVENVQIMADAGCKAAREELARSLRHVYPYRTNAKCRISWCIEPPGHDGWHFGAPTCSCPGGMTSRRTAPPNAENTDVLGVTQIEPDPDLK